MKKRQLQAARTGRLVLKNRFMRAAMGFMAIITGLMSRASTTDSTFTIQGEMGKLAVHHQLSEAKAQKLPIVIICHGLGGNQNESLISKIAADALKEGVGVVRFDFNGHGESEVDFQQMDALNIQDDLRRAIEWTEQQPFTESVSLVGHSLGGIVPYKYAIRYSEVPCAELKLIEGDNHGFTNSADTTAEYIAEWLRKNSRERNNTINFEEKQSTSPDCFSFSLNALILKS